MLTEEEKARLTAAYNSVAHSPGGVSLEEYLNKAEAKTMDKQKQIKKILRNALNEAEMRQGCTDYTPYVNALYDQLFQPSEQGEQCPRCKGIGEYGLNEGDICTKCGGSGKVTKPVVPAEQAELLKEAISKWGESLQMVMAVEECSELQKEVCKIMRGDRSLDRINKLASEIADVRLMCLQLEYMFGIWNKVAEETTAKLERLKRLLNE